MLIRRLLAATDETLGGRHAVHVAHDLARALAARLTILTVTAVDGRSRFPAGRLISSKAPGGSSGAPQLEEFRAWLGESRSNGLPEPPEIAVGFGVAGIEIGRVADQRAADLIVLGRQPRSPDHRLMLGETADALVRRSGVPTLFVPPQISAFHRIVVGLDGSDRTLGLLHLAIGLARATGARLEAITVEPPLADNATVPGSMPQGRTVRLCEALGGIGSRDPEGGTVPVVVRRGNPIEEILLYVRETQADLLVIGYRRGGPPKIVGLEDVARNLLFSAPSAVLTIPL